MCFDEKMLYKISSSVVCRVDWTGEKNVKAGKRPAEVFAVAQAGGVTSTWAQMGAMEPLQS